MKKIILACAISFCTFTSFTPETNFDAYGPDKDFPSLLTPATGDLAAATWVDSLYSLMNLEKMGLQKEAFFIACKGYEYLLNQGSLIKQNLLTVCDFSQSSKKKRLYVLDMVEGKVLYNTYVSHGRNSGGEYASSFSNSADSYKSSLGFMVTSDTYNGGNGYSMRFNGLEKGFNNNVRNRDIVMHGSDYVADNRVAAGQVTGRSFGCPAVSREMHKKIIDCIKNGSCFFSYYPNPLYTNASRIINANFTWPAIKHIQPSLPVDSGNQVINDNLANTVIPYLSPIPASTN